MNAKVEAAKWEGTATTLNPFPATFLWKCSKKILNPFHSVAVCSEKAFSQFPIVRRAAGHSAMS